MKKDIILIGGGGHAKVIIDIIRQSEQFNIVGICDQNKGQMYGVPVIGTDDDLELFYKEGIEYAFICIGALGSPLKRWSIYENLKKIGYKLPILIHENAVISPSVKIAEGTCIMAGVYINADVSVGRMAIINTGSIVEHDCIVGDNVHLSPRACVCGGGRINHHTHVGAGAVINQGLCIGEEVVIGSGSVVIKNIEDYSKVVGVPAKRI